MMSPQELQDLDDMILHCRLGIKIARRSIERGREFKEFGGGPVDIEVAHVALYRATAQLERLEAIAAADKMES